LLVYSKLGVSKTKVNSFLINNQIRNGCKEQAKDSKPQPDDWGLLGYGFANCQYLTRDRSIPATLGQTTWKSMEYE